MEKNLNFKENLGLRCPRCQSPLSTVNVHGHEQCIYCKSNIFECCSGDTCETDLNLNISYKKS